MKLLRKFFSLKPSNQSLLVTTLLLLTTVRLSLWLLPFPIWRQILSRITQTTVQKQADLARFSALLNSKMIQWIYFVGWASCPSIIKGRQDAYPTRIIPQFSHARVSWAVMTASRCMPEVKCLARALTTQILLLWHGVGANLYIGVAKDESGKLEAHAWVESQGKIVIGALPDISRYTPLPSLMTKNLL